VRKIVAAIGAIVLLLVQLDAQQRGQGAGQAGTPAAAQGGGRGGNPNEIVVGQLGGKPVVQPVRRGVDYRDAISPTDPAMNGPVPRLPTDIPTYPDRGRAADPITTWAWKVD
jgi:hypothetical protein